MAGISAIQKYLRPAQDGGWEESKHHRADNGRFTAGSGRRGSSGERHDGDGAKGGGSPSGGKRREMSEERASEFVRDAFKKAGRRLEGLKLSGRALEADTDRADEAACSAVNEFLTKHGLRAKVAGKSKFRIAEDGFDDIQASGSAMDGVLDCLCRMIAQKGGDGDGAIEKVVAKGVYFRPDGEAQDALTIKKDLAGRPVIA